MLEATPRDVRDPESCVFYHSIDLPTYGPQAGVWDLRGRFDDYTAHVALSARSLLDVGTATGFLTFEAEKRGARVTSLDVSDAELWAYLPIRESPFVKDYPAWRAEADAKAEGWKNSYWLSHRDLGSSARCVYGNVYELSPDVGSFDVVVLGQILVHLKDGISALTAAASVCAETMVIVEGSFENDTPIAALCGRADKPDVAYAWYQYSTGWYREILTMLGFREITVTTGSYLCNHDRHDSNIELTTIVASR